MGWMACSPESTPMMIRLDGGGGASAPTAGTTGAAGTGEPVAGTSGTAGSAGGGEAGTTGAAGMGAGGDPQGAAGMGAGGDPAGTGGTGAGGGTTGTAGAGAGGGTTGTAGTGAGGSATGRAGTGGGTAGATGAAGAGGGRAGTTGTAGGGGSTGAGGAGGAENKIVLYDGTAASFNGWASIRNPSGPNPWRNNADGTMTVVTNTGDIQSKMKFQDMFIHVEYLTPVWQATDTGATGQRRGNSGVYLKGSYEMQILDSYGMAPAIDGCGAVYGKRAPSSTACYMGGQWNTYEIEFKANVCNAQGQKTANARIVRATLNGVEVHRDFEVTSVTTAGQAESCSAAGVLLQDHDSVKPVVYRNIWVIPRN